MSQPTLDRTIGPVAATLLVIGGIVGSGIFLTTGIMAKALPSPTLILLAWIIGGLFALAGALTYAEMAAMFPRAGGVYVYLTRRSDRCRGFSTAGRCCSCCSAAAAPPSRSDLPITSATSSPLLSNKHVLVSVPLGSWTWTMSAGQLVAVASLVALGLVNYVGVRSGSATNAVLTLAKVAGLALLPCSRSSRRT